MSKIRAVGLPEIKHQSVRDLAWAIASPPLIVFSCHRCTWPTSQWYQQLFEESLPWFYELDSDPSELDGLLAEQKDRRLGKYFETLWFYWLSHNPRFEIVENNVQIIIDGETLGEIDFIVFDKKTKQTAHWELAVKFYLGDGDTREMQNWHGPNRRDRLDIKVDHLLYKQSVIGYNQRVKQWLHKQGIKIDQCSVIMKGRLYHPWPYSPVQATMPLPQPAPSKAVAPPQCSAGVITGCWFNLSQFDEVFDKTAHFVPLINVGWMEKIPTSEVIVGYSKMDIYETVSNKKMRYPLHLLLCEPLYSFDRVFLVDDNWSIKAA
jgi:hypothetical protein